jgi:hypothetical protein
MHRRRPLPLCSRRFAWICALAFGAVSSFVPAAQAAPESEGVREAVAVEVSIFGDPEGRAELDDSLHDVIKLLGLTMAAPGEKNVLARVVIDLRESSEAKVLVADHDGHTAVSKRLPRASSTEVMREEIAFVVADALDALKARNREEAPPPPPPPNATPNVVTHDAPREPPPQESSTATPRSVRLELGPAFSVRGRDSSARTELGANLGARLSGTGDTRPAIAASIGIDVPYDASTSDASVRISPLVIRVVPSIAKPISRTIELEGAALLGVDVVRATPTSRDANVTSNAPTTDASPIVGAAVIGRLALGSARLSLGLGFETDLSRHRYVLATDAGTSVVLSPWLVRPTLTLGIALPLYGGDDAP